MSRRSFDRAIATGLLARLAPNVALLAGAEVTPTARIAAWAYSVGPGSVCSHRSAAFLWGADVVGDAPVDLVTRRGTDRGAAGSVVVHRPRDGEAVHAVVRRGLHVTSPLRTLVDLGAVDHASVGPALEQFLVAGFVAPKSVARNAHRDRRRGRPGSAAVLAAMDTLAIDGVLRDSMLESRARSILDRPGLQGFLFHHVIGPYEVDFAYPAEQVVVEVDGWVVHGRRESFEGDRERDAWITAQGWAVLRFTWRQVTNRPGWVAGRIGDTLSRRGRPPIAA